MTHTITLTSIKRGEMIARTAQGEIGYLNLWDDGEVTATAYTHPFEGLVRDLPTLREAVEFLATHGRPL